MGWYHIYLITIVVTGASYGIGEGFAYQLAARGVNVVLLARSEDKMKVIAENIGKKLI
jgi:short-subunit dehydrogenase